MKIILLLSLSLIIAYTIQIDTTNSSERKPLIESQTNTRQLQEDGGPFNFFELFLDGSHEKFASAASETEAAPCPEGVECNFEDGLEKVIGFGTVFIESLDDLFTTSYFDCTQVLTSIACNSHHACDLTLNTFDSDLCEVEDSVDFSFQSTFNLPISSFIEKLPSCSDLCSGKLEETASGFISFHTMVNYANELYGHELTDIFGVAIWYSKSEYLWCQFEFCPGESQHFDITVPCLQESLNLDIYYCTEDLEWELVSTGYSGCDPITHPAGQYFFDFSMIGYYLWNKIIYRTGYVLEYPVYGEPQCEVVDIEQSSNDEDGDSYQDLVQSFGSNLSSSMVCLCLLVFGILLEML